MHVYSVPSIRKTDFFRHDQSVEKHSYKSHKNIILCINIYTVYYWSLAISTHYFPFDNLYCIK